MGNIAYVFHFSFESMCAMGLFEIEDWGARAIALHQRLNGCEED